MTIHDDMTVTMIYRAFYLHCVNTPLSSSLVFAKRYFTLKLTSDLAGFHILNLSNSVRYTVCTHI